MKVIILDEKHGGTRSLALGGWARLTLTICLLGLPVVLGYLGHQVAAARGAEHYSEKASQAVVDSLERQEAEIRRARDDAQAQLQALTLRIANLQVSSPFARRIDPLTGNLARHQGVDFGTGKLGGDVQAVASGVVTFTGERPGKDLLVQINHGNGYETLYAHDQEILVKPGDVVKKGQLIALSGTSGRSTGPHVHFEVHKHGRVVDPASYIQRNHR